MGRKTTAEILKEIRDGWKDFSNFTIDDVERNIADRKKEFYLAKTKLERDLVDDLHFLQILREEVEKNMTAERGG